MFLQIHGSNSVWSTNCLKEEKKAALHLYTIKMKENTCDRQATKTRWISRRCGLKDYLTPKKFLMTSEGWHCPVTPTQLELPTLEDTFLTETELPLRKTLPIHSEHRPSMQSTSQESPSQWSTQLLNCARPGYSSDLVLKFSNEIYISKLGDILNKQVKTFSSFNWKLGSSLKHQHRYDIQKIHKPKFTVEISFKIDITTLWLQNFTKRSSYR